jgi:hypothetical protein
MNPIKYLSEICLPFEECVQLNNTKPSALAWVYNPFKNTPEWEVTPVQKIAKMDHGQLVDLLSRSQDSPGWEIYPAEVFVSMEQIKLLMEKEQFYYAPLSSSRPLHPCPSY